MLNAKHMATTGNCGSERDRRASSTFLSDTHFCLVFDYTRHESLIRSIITGMSVLLEVKRKNFNFLFA